MKKIFFCFIFLSTMPLCMPGMNIKDKWRYGYYSEKKINLKELIGEKISDIAFANKYPRFIKDQETLQCPIDQEHNYIIFTEDKNIIKGTAKPKFVYCLSNQKLIKKTEIIPQYLKITLNDMFSNGNDYIRSLGVVYNIMKDLEGRYRYLSLSYVASYQNFHESYAQTGSSINHHKGDSLTYKDEKKMIRDSSLSAYTLYGEKDYETVIVASKNQVMVEESINIDNEIVLEKKLKSYISIFSLAPIGTLVEKLMPYTPDLLAALSNNGNTLAVYNTKTCLLSLFKIKEWEKQVGFAVSDEQTKLYGNIEFKFLAK